MKSIFLRVLYLMWGIAYNSSFTMAQTPMKEIKSPEIQKIEQKDQPHINNENNNNQLQARQNIASADQNNLKNEFKPVAYHAKYKIILDKKKPMDPSIHEVNGILEMTVTEEVTEEKNVWTLHQKSNLFIYYKDQPLADTYAVTIASFEAKDGQSYECYVRSLVNDEEEAILKTDAKIPQGQEGFAHYTLPDIKTVKLPKGTLFPLQHLHLLVKSALNNANTVAQKKIFDGASDIQDVVEVDSFITPLPKFKLNLTPKEDEPWPQDFAQRLQNAKAWHFYFNVFPIENGDDLDPEYTFSETVLDSGIVTSMEVEYPDPEFSVKIVLIEIAPIHHTVNNLAPSQGN